MLPIISFLESEVFPRNYMKSYYLIIARRQIHFTNFWTLAKENFVNNHILFYFFTSRIFTSKKSQVINIKYYEMFLRTAVTVNGVKLWILFYKWLWDFPYSSSCSFRLLDAIHNIECFLGRTNVDGFLSLSKKLMICGPKDSPPKFQPSIRSKSARIKTRAENEHSLDDSHCTSQPYSFDSSRFTSNWRLKF